MFFGIFGNPLSKTSYFQNNFLHAMAVLGYLPKLKRGLGLAFGAHFLHGQSFNVIIFFFLKISNKMCYKFHI